MRVRSAEKGALIALLLLLIVPAFSSTKAQPNVPIAIYAPSKIPGMPLPAQTPIVGYAPQKALPTSGVIRVLLIAAAFSDVNYTLSISTIKQNYFGFLAAYYHEDSLGTLTIQGDAYGWYKLPYPEAHYGRNCLTVNDADCSGSDTSWQIANDVVVLAQRDNVDFNNYDYFAFIHSGYGQESSGVKDDVWSVTYLGGVSVTTSTRTLTRFNIDPELEAGSSVPYGVWCHEFGHNLGLPDLYNTQTGQTIMGSWELMDKGLWNGDPPGSSPAHMSAWSKIQLGFISGPILAVANVGFTSTYTVDPTEIASSNVHAIEIPFTSTLASSQYYLVEARSATGYDSALPATGVLITHVDNTATMGRVHVMDGHPSVADLMDAVWNVGQTFTDSNNNVVVTVTAKVGNSYQITVNRGGQLPPQPPQNQTYVHLAITNIIAQPQVITSPNTTVTVTIQIANSGNLAVTNVQVQVTLDGQMYTNLAVSVGGNSLTQTNFTWVSTIGSHAFQVTVDPNQTINDTNRASYVATFYLNVGPTLTINVPLNVTSAGNVWISINGIKYNLTSNQFQASVPNGTVTIQIQPAVNTLPGVRQLFSSWSDGNFSNPRQILVTTATVLQANYGTQYLLSIDQSSGSTTTSGWYSPNSIITVSASNPSNVTANTSRLLFNGWTGDMNSNSPYMKVNMTKPVTLKANWITQYYITIISPTGSPTGSGWYNLGQIATVSVQSTVQYTNGTRHVFTRWNSTLLGQNPTGQFTVNSAATIQAAWKTQYLLNLQSEHGTTGGSGWYDAGSTAPVSIQREINHGNATRRIFKGWTGHVTSPSSNLTVRMDSPKALNARWSTEYMITFKAVGVSNATIIKLNVNNATHDLSVNRNYQGWYEKGTTINPTLNETITDGFLIYRFTGWRNSTGAVLQSPLTLNKPETYIATYSTEVTLPPIPGFPTEATLIGILIGIVFLTFRRRKHNRSTEGRLVN
jgi:M6 family metalloprotease-like protein/uncharacterized repeat protein (TIGR02543 family)